MGIIPLGIINLSNNRIVTIESGSFGPNLKTLYLSCNMLNSFEPKWFQNSSNLLDLGLNGNKLKTLPNNLFKNFPALRTIRLQDNHIATIGEGAFSGSKHIDFLYLDNNKLLEFPSNIFQDQVKVNQLDINNNMLSYLSKDLMNKLNATDAVVHGNPWQCACYEEIKKWSTYFRYEHFKEPPGAPRCVVPKTFKDTCIEIIDFELIDYYKKQVPETYKKEVCENEF